MFFHSFKYCVLRSIREGSTAFWNFMFPIILATFFSIAFSGMTEDTSSFEDIKVAVVQGDNQTDYLNQVLDQLSAENEQGFLEIKRVDLKEAKELLKQEKVAGIIIDNDMPQLLVEKQDYSQSILKSVLDTYVQNKHMVNRIFSENSDLQALNEIFNTAGINNEEVSLGNAGNGGMGDIMNTLIAMTAMFAAFLGIGTTAHLQANQSTIALRRGVSPQYKSVIIFSEFLASLMLQMVSVIILIIYTKFILRMDIGDNYSMMLLITLIGSALGLALGTAYGAALKIKQGVKIVSMISITMLLSTMAGMMSGTFIKVWIEAKLPILNRLNPVTLIADSFYCLSVYDNYDRVFRNLMIMVIYTAVLSIIAIVALRRKKYASV